MPISMPKAFISKHWKALAIFFLGVIVTWAITEGLNAWKEESSKKPSVELEFFVKPEGKTFPITIKNNGDFELSRAKVSISSCYMDDSSKVYFKDGTGNLAKNEAWQIPFEDDKTSDWFSRLDCIQGRVNFSNYGRVELQAWKDIRTGKIYVEPINKTLIVCGYCFWNVTFTSQEYNESFREQAYSPIDLLFGAYPAENQSAMPQKEYLVPLSPIGLGFFDERILKIDS